MEDVFKKLRLNVRPNVTANRHQRFYIRSHDESSKGSQDGFTSL